MKIKKGTILTLKIESLAFGGPGIAKYSEENSDSMENSAKKLAIFVEGVAPGDLVEAQVFMIKRNMAKAKVVKFLKMATNRIEAKCKHFGPVIDQAGNVMEKMPDGGVNIKKNCGGCSWQFLSYEDQLKVKTQMVFDSLKRLGNISEEDLKSVFLPTLGMENPWNYRNKMDFSFGKNRAGEMTIGLHMKNRFYDVTEIEECHLARPWVGKLVGKMRQFFAEMDWPEGMIPQSLVIRTSTNTGETLINLLVENGEVDFAEEFAEALQAFFEGGEAADDKLVSIFITQIINKKGSRKQQKEILIFGKESFREELKLSDGRTLKFEVAPSAFIQPNSRQAEVIYSRIVEIADLKGKEKVFDLFCGTGTIGLALSAGAGEITGLEINESSVENAKANATLNGIDKMKFVIGDAHIKMAEMGQDVDLIVVDPPRAGLSEKTIEEILATRAKRVIYVSCNPTTLARDLQFFRKNGFTLKLVQAVDQFCQTYHVETLVLLER